MGLGRAATPGRPQVKKMPPYLDCEGNVSQGGYSFSNVTGNTYNISFLISCY
jgi:hypothetical protein